MSLIIFPPLRIISRVPFSHQVQLTFYFFHEIPQHPPPPASFGLHCPWATVALGSVSWGRETASRHSWFQSTSATYNPSYLTSQSFRFLNCENGLQDNAYSFGGKKVSYSSIVPGHRRQFTLVSIFLSLSLVSHLEYTTVRPDKLIQIDMRKM